MKKIIPLLLISFIWACKNKKNLPNNLINEEDMAYYIGHLQLLENEVNRSSYDVKDSVKVAYLTLAEEMLQKKNYDTVQYRISYEYYSKQPETFLRLYENAIKIIEKEQKHEGEPSNNTNVQRN